MNGRLPATTPTLLLMGTIPAEAMAPGENGASFFKFAGNDLMVAPVVAEGKVAGLKLINVTNGFDNAKLLTTTGARKP